MTFGVPGAPAYSALQLQNMADAAYQLAGAAQTAASINSSPCLQITVQQTTVVTQKSSYGG